MRLTNLQNEELQFLIGMVKNSERDLRQAYVEWDMKEPSMYIYTQKLDRVQECKKQRTEALLSLARFVMKAFGS